MSTVRRIRFNRTLFSAPMNGHAPAEMVAHLAAEDIELILDIRDGTTASKQLDELCEDAAIYYVHRPIFSEPRREPDKEQEGQIDQTTSWVAGLSLRHRTCVIGDDKDIRLALCRQIATSAGQRLIDLEDSPAPVAEPDKATG